MPAGGRYSKQAGSRQGRLVPTGGDLLALIIDGRPPAGPVVAVLAGCAGAVRGAAHHFREGARRAAQEKGEVSRQEACTAGEVAAVVALGMGCCATPMQCSGSSAVSS